MASTPEPLVPEPLMKAAQLKANLAHLHRLGDADEKAILAAMPAAWLEEIRERPRVAWLPLEYDLVLSRLVAEHCGMARAFAWGRDSVREAAESPMLRNLVRPALRLFRTQPTSLMRLIPRMMATMFKHCGEYTAEPAGEQPAIVGTRMPAILVGDLLYLRGIGESFALMWILCGADEQLVHTEVTGVDRVRWTVASEPPR